MDKVVKSSIGNEDNVLKDVSLLCSLACLVPWSKMFVVADSPCIEDSSDIRRTTSYDGLESSLSKSLDNFLNDPPYEKCNPQQGAPKMSTTNPWAITKKL